MHVNVGMGGLMEAILPLSFNLHQLAVFISREHVRTSAAFVYRKHTFSLPMRSLVRRRLMFVSAGTRMVGPNMPTVCSSPLSPPL